MGKYLCINFLQNWDEELKRRAREVTNENSTLVFKEWIDMDSYREWLDSDTYKSVLFDIYDFKHPEELYEFICITDEFFIKSLYGLLTSIELLQENSTTEFINFITNGGI